MAELKEDSTLLSWSEGRATVNPKSLNDFDSRGDYYKPINNESFYTGEAQVRKNNSGSSFGVFPCYSDSKRTKFVGYLSFRKLQGLRYDGIKVSKAKKRYASFEVMNRFIIDGTVRFGADSIAEKFSKSKFTCTNVIPQEIPAYVENAEPTEENMVEDVYYLLDKK